MSAENPEEKPGAGKPGPERLNPGDDASPGTPGTGEDVCPKCQGSGRAGADECTNCGGTGIVTKGIAGG
jgi:hypothetical protein